jgi:4,5-dihydroxyphthalate decarboxylase
VTSSLQLGIALGDYDINRPLIDGAVSPQGVELIPTVKSSPERHWRMLIHEEFDICEMSMGSFAALRGRGDDRFVGIPVFPHRRFRHSFIFVSRARGIQRAEELRGTRVGVRSWQTTAGIYMRGFLADHYGLPLDSVEWVAQDGDDVPIDLPEGVSLTRVPDGRTVTEMCASGELAALLYPEIPDEVHEQTGRIVRLFSDPRAEEEAHFRRTGIFPIMHLVVIRRALVEKHPWLCRNLVAAFDEAKTLAMTRLRDPRTVSLAWLRWLIEHERALLGDDPWVNGLAPNHHVLETFLRYAVEQGVSATQLRPEELFHPSVIDDPPGYV